MIGEPGVGKSAIFRTAQAPNFNVNEVHDLAPSTAVEKFTIPNEGAGRLPFDLTFVDVRKYYHRHMLCPNIAINHFHSGFGPILWKRFNALARCDSCLDLLRFDAQRNF